MTDFEVRLKSTWVPPNGNQQTARVVIGGAGRAHPGNTVYQDNTKSPHVMTSTGDLITEFPPNGITITRVPYCWPDDHVITSAPYSVKEQLARFSEKGVIECLQGGAILTAAQIRAL